VAAHGEDFVIVVCTVSIWLQGVTDRETDGRTDPSAVAKTRKALHAVERKKRFYTCSLNYSYYVSFVQKDLEIGQLKKQRESAIVEAQDQRSTIFKFLVNGEIAR